MIRQTRHYEVFDLQEAIDLMTKYPELRKQPGLIQISLRFEEVQEISVTNLLPFGFLDFCYVRADLPIEVIFNRVYPYHIGYTSERSTKDTRTQRILAPSRLQADIWAKNVGATAYVQHPCVSIRYSRTPASCIKTHHVELA